MCKAPVLIHFPISGRNASSHNSPCPCFTFKDLSPPTSNIAPPISIPLSQLCQAGWAPPKKSRWKSLGVGSEAGGVSKGFSCRPGSVTSQLPLRSPQWTCSVPGRPHAFISAAFMGCNLSWDTSLQLLFCSDLRFSFRIHLRCHLMDPTVA